MPEQRNGWYKFLVNIVWCVVVGFAGLCIMGYFVLDRKAEAITKESAQERKLIRDNLTDRYEKLNYKVDCVKDTVNDIKLEQREIIVTQKVILNKLQ